MPLKIKFSGFDILISPQHKYLAMFLDNKLTWTLHINHIIEKCGRLIWVKGHAGIKYNEIVDNLAKNCTKLNDVKDLRCYYDFIPLLYSKIKENMEKFCPKFA